MLQVFLFLLCLFVFCCLFPFSLSCFLPVDLDLFLDLCSSFCWWFFDLFVALFRCVSCSAALFVPLHVLDATHYLWVIGKWALGHQSKARDSVLRRSNTWGIAPMLETSAPDCWGCASQDIAGE
jgi:hypothetical protein